MQLPKWSHRFVPWRACVVDPSARSRARPARIRASASNRGLCHTLAAAALLVAGPVYPFAPEIALEPRTGHAWSLATGELVYRELHHPEVVDGRLRRDRVEYRGPGGELIARKAVDYGPDPLCPAFLLEDFRSGYIEGLEWSGNGRPELFHRDGADARVERVEVAPERLVADAGFDLLVYRELGALQDGARPEFPFAVPSRLDTLTFRLRKLDRRRVLGRAATVVRMEPANALLRWLVEPIDVAYDAATGALLRYEGISNLPNPDGDGNYRVRIDFPPAGVDPEPPTAESGKPVKRR